MECPHCHTQIAEGGKFCSECGAPLAPAPEQPAVEPEAVVEAAETVAPIAAVEPTTPTPPAAPAASTASSGPAAPSAPTEPTAPAASETATAEPAASGAVTAAGTAASPSVPSQSANSEMAAAGSDSKETDVFAVASLVCSIISIFFAPLILSLLGIIFGVIARKRNDNNSTNGKMALAGLIIGIIVMVLCILLVLFVGVVACSAGVVGLDYY